MKKIFRIFLLTIAAVIVVALAYVVITFPPVMAGMAAKTICSCVFLTGRDPQSVRDKELQVFPGLSSAPIDVNADSTVTATVFWKTSKAIFRKGLGCTLLAEQSEEEVRAQRMILPPLPASQDAVAWPSGDALDSVPANINRDLVEQALDHAFEETDPKRPINTHAVVVVYDGKIIGERYAEGFNKDSRLTGWSMTKSITNALVGILVKEGRLNVEAAAPVAEWDDDRNKITLNHLLQASSGLEWSESYFNPTGSFHQMFIKRDDKGGYAATKNLTHAPGTFFQYSSGTTNLISKIIRQTVGDSTYYKFPFEKLFYKIGMNHMIMEPDASGTFVGSSYSYASARDWARLGLLYLNDGVWNGETILPSGWAKYSVTPAPAAEMGKYGAHWWLNAGDPHDAQLRKYPALPADTFWADGFEEQYAMVIPSKKLVIVRLGVSHHGFDITKLVTGVISALHEENGNR